ncbi:ABC-2 transporter permease [Paenibacillus senegalensis]|uniref:ABC transporter permease subunit n=1 Tax=Paenibacillus senegalensis TaxID=1465766 RepID=UPI00028933D2|nr:ABC transporter permease subunit [Paenibacillus senegalensis]
MSKIGAICRKELQLYFYSPTAYVAFAFFFAVSGFMFSLDFLSFPVVDIRAFLGNILVLYLFTVPLLTMRLVSDELRQGTDELLLTSPASIWDIVIGKYAAALLVQFLLVAGSLIYPLIMSYFGDLDMPVLWLTYVSLFLLGAAMMAVGLFASTLTAHQMVAGIIGFALLMGLWMIDWIGESLFYSAREIIGMFSIVGRMENMMKGVFDAADVLFYVTLSAVFIVLSRQTLESKRWR